MNLAQQLADDYRHIDGIEEVTLEPIAGDGSTSTPVTGIKALRRHARSRAAQPRAAGAAIDEEQLIWHLWKSTLGAHIPVPGDVVLSGDGTRWTIQQAESQTLGTRWRLVCERNLEA